MKPRKNPDSTSSLNQDFIFLLYASLRFFDNTTPAPKAHAAGNKAKTNAARSNAAAIFVFDAFITVPI